MNINVQFVIYYILLARNNLILTFLFLEIVDILN